MQLFQSSHIFPHPWQHVTMANWRKYPNQNSPQVIHVDVVDRHVTPCGKLYTERIIACRQPLPSLVQKLLGTDSVLYVRETSLVDPKTQTYTATSKNLTYSNLITLEERIVYQSDPSTADNSATVLQQEAKVVAVGVLSSLRSKIEEFCVGRCQHNAEKGRKGLEEVIRSLTTSSETEKTPMSA